MSVPPLPVDRDAFIPDQHKGKQVTADAAAAGGGEEIRVLAAPIRCASAPGSSPGRIKAERADSSSNLPFCQSQYHNRLCALATALEETAVICLAGIDAFRDN